MGAASGKREVISRSRVGADCGLGGKRGRDSPLAAEEEVDGGRIGGKAAWWTGETIAFELVHGSAQLATGEEGVEFGVVVDSSGGWRGVARGWACRRRRR